MARRNLLAIHKLEAFRAWCLENNIPVRDTPNYQYQVLQVWLNGKWNPIYKRLEAKVHLSVSRNLTKMVEQFIQQQK